MLPQHVLDYTRTLFPDFRSSTEWSITPLDKGGSGRLYYRIQCGGQSMIFVKYNDHREENRHFVEIARFLSRCGIQVPQIYQHDPQEGLIWMQDLGAEDLWSFHDSAWSVRRSLYASALRQVARLHGHAHRILPGAGLKLQLEFDETLYLWEQGYFFEHALQGIFGLSAQEVKKLQHTPALREMAQSLANLPRVLVHRDFQSQNIMIHEAGAWLIDFQGLRPGLPHYDVASLLYDPYVQLEESERAELISDYLEAAVQEGVPLEGNFEEVLLACAAQRLMQALGAYGFLGLKCGRPAFLRYVPTAKNSLRQVLARLDGHEDVVHLLDSIREPAH